MEVSTRILSPSPSLSLSLSLCGGGGFVAEDGSDVIYVIGTVVYTRTRVLIAFSSGLSRVVGAAADVSGDVYRARLGDFRRPRIGASAGAALSKRVPVAGASRGGGRRSCVVPASRSPRGRSLVLELLMRSR